MITPAYRHDLDGLRGIAVVMAVLFHAFPSLLSGGFIGVEIFFVVSGFLIGTILLQATRDGSFTYREFYARRVRRIFPALAVMLAGVLGAGWFLLLGDEYRALGKHVVAGAGFVSNLAHWAEVGYFDSAAETKPLLHLWSLGVEEQFYIVLPPLLLLIHRLRLNMRATIGLLWVLSFAANLWLTSVDRTHAFYSPVPRLWELLTGCLLASYTLDPLRVLPSWFVRWRSSAILQNLTALIGLLLIVVPSTQLDRFSYFPGGWTLLPVCGTTLLIAVGDRAFINRRVLSHRALTWVGLISYPLYLWHWPLLSIGHLLNGSVPDVATRAGLVGWSLVLAVLTYYGIEQPARFGRLRRVAVPVLSAVMLVLAGLGALVWRGDVLQSRPLSQREAFLHGQAFANYALGAANELKACDGIDGVVGEARQICRAASTEVGAPFLLLWGDSQVRSWVPVFARIAQQQGLRLLVFSHPGCVPLLNVRRTDVLAGECNPLRSEQVLQSIANLDVRHVVLISNWSIHLNGLRERGVLQPATHFMTDQPEGSADHASSAAAFARQFPATVERLAATGASVLVLKAPPILRESVWAGYVRHPDSYEPLVQEHREASQRSSRQIDAVVQQGRARAFDVAQYLCDKKCSAVYQGTLMYGDDNHLTTTGCMLFETQLRRGLNLHGAHD